MRWIEISQSNFTENFFFVFIWGYFLCHNRRQCDPNYPFSNSPKTVLPNCSMKRIVQPCEMSSHNTNQFLREFPSNFFWGYFLFHHSLQCTPKYPSQTAQKQWYQSAPSTETFSSVRWMQKSQRRFSESFSPLFISADTNRREGFWETIFWCVYSPQRDKPFCWLSSLASLFLWCLRRDIWEHIEVDGTKANLLHRWKLERSFQRHLFVMGEFISQM